MKLTTTTPTLPSTAEVIFTPGGFLLQGDSAKKNASSVLYELGFREISPDSQASYEFLHRISTAFVQNLTEDGELPLTQKVKPLSTEKAEELLAGTPFVLGREYIDLDWIFARWEELSRVFGEEWLDSGLEIPEYLSQKTGRTLAGRVYFHLVEHKEDGFPFAFLASYASKKKTKVSHLPLKHALKEYKEDTKAIVSLLHTVNSVGERSEFIAELMETGELFSPLRLTSEEAYTFLKEIPLYEECGVMCRIPDWWKKKNSISVAVSLGEKGDSGVGLDHLMDFQANVLLGDLTLTAEEVRELLEQANGLLLIKGKWVEIDQEKLKQALEAMENVTNLGEITMSEALRLELGMKNQDNISEDIPCQFTHGQWFSHFLQQLQCPATLPPQSPGKHFTAELRPYQQEGVTWLAKLGECGLGALLADDMGLGKTVQVLALLSALKNRKRRRKLAVLLIVPASLLCNWQQEAKKFAPHLAVQVLHGTTREFSPKEADLFLTTYGMLSKMEDLMEFSWELVILDEGQAIKNPGTKQTKLVKALHCDRRIVLTGTPIENKVTDLWSIFDFINPGLLGNIREFKTFYESLRENPQGYQKLQQMTSPFILRRLKTDKNIIADLPEKNEIFTPVSLTKKQIVLYKETVRKLEETMVSLDGMARKGAVLGAITKLKQICNHPDQFLGQVSYAKAHSGKFQALADICETIQAKREKVLIFTQFREITPYLAEFLAEVFGQTGLVLHGGTSVKKRGEMVERFNGADYVPFMVLSLKAGGVGLNLTGANHVIHFDRWWNPAVENQATDRAFRIGQRKDVFVHKFVTVGTLEEKINRILREKQELSQEILASAGEKWVTEMSDEELHYLFRLEV